MKTRATATPDVTMAGKDPKYLYTYLPRPNTVPEEGILATALVDPEKHGTSGWTKYLKRVAKYPEYTQDREGVLRWLDDSVPGIRRSMSVSVLSEPVGRKASGNLKRFARSHDLYRLEPALKLLAAGVIDRIYLAHNDGVGGGQPVPDTRKAGLVDWSRTSDSDSYLFSKVPHYFLETVDGHIPTEYARKMNMDKKATASGAAIGALAGAGITGGAAYLLAKILKAKSPAAWGISTALYGGLLGAAAGERASADSGSDRYSLGRRSAHLGPGDLDAYGIKADSTLDLKTDSILDIEPSDLFGPGKGADAWWGE